MTPVEKILTSDIWAQRVWLPVWRICNATGLDQETCEQALRSLVEQQRCEKLSVRVSGITRVKYLPVSLAQKYVRNRWDRTLCA